MASARRLLDQRHDDTQAHVYEERPDYKHSPILIPFFASTRCLPVSAPRHKASGHHRAGVGWTAHCPIENPARIGPECADRLPQNRESARARDRRDRCSYFLPNNVWTLVLLARTVLTRETENARSKTPPTTVNEKAMLKLLSKPFRAGAGSALPFARALPNAGHRRLRTVGGLGRAQRSFRRPPQSAEADASCRIPAREGRGRPLITAHARDCLRHEECSSLIGERIMSRELFESLLAPNLRGLRRLVRTRVRTPGDAEDVLQEILLRAFSHRDQLRDRAKFGTWLWSIALNEIRAA